MDRYLVAPDRRAGTMRRVICREQRLPLQTIRRLLLLIALALAAVAFGGLRMTPQGAAAVSPTREIENIVTVAGIGAYIGDGSPATAAGLNLLEGIAVDAFGNLWIADTGNNRIRKVDALTGVITTVVGSGAVGSSGDGGLATQARLNSPSDLALDALGNLYFTDAGNNRVRRVDSVTGMITTVAGTGIAGYFGDGDPAVDAQLNNPRGIVLSMEASGLCIYIAEVRSHVVRKIDAAGLISTVAGTGVSASSPDGGLATQTPLNTPFGVALDVAGNIYIGEAGSHRVRKVDALSKIITTIAGAGVPGSSANGVLATAAQINSPRDIAFDALGNLYFVDAGNNRVRVVNVPAGAGATIATAAGSGVFGFFGDGGLATAAQFANPFFIAFDPSGNLYIGDRGNSRARKIDRIGQFITTVAGGFAPAPIEGQAAISAYLLNPAGLAIDASANMYIAENFGNRIRRIDSLHGTITTIAGTGQIGFSPDGTPAINAMINGPQAIVLDAAMNFYIAEAGNFRVRKIDGSGVLTTLAGSGIPGASGDGGPATLARLGGVRALALDAGGNLWITDSTNHRVRFVNLSPAPVSIADQVVAPGGIITVVGTGIPGFSGDGGPAAAARINLPVGLAFSAAGGLFVSETNRVRFVNLGSTPIVIHNTVVAPFHITTVAGTGVPGDMGDGGLAVAAQLFGPQGLVVDASDNLYISEANNNRIREVDVTGVITTIAGTGAQGFSGDGGPAVASALQNPRYIALDASGNLHFSEFGGSRVRRLNVAMKDLTVIGASGNVLAWLQLYDQRSLNDLSDVTLTAFDSTGKPISATFHGVPVATGNPLERLFRFGSEGALLTGEGLRLDGRFLSDGRRFSGDCTSQGRGRC